MKVTAFLCPRRDCFAVATPAPLASGEHPRLPRSRHGRGRRRPGGWTRARPWGTSATGTVEAQRAGRWLRAAVRRGHREWIDPFDVVRAAAGSAAVLRLAAGTEIELRAGVEIGLDQLPGGPSCRPAAWPRPGAGGGGGAETLAFTAGPRTRTVNEGPARFVVRADEQGRVSVAALEGKTRFTAGGKSVALGAGTTSSSVGGAPPDNAGAGIAEDVLLNVG